MTKKKRFNPCFGRNYFGRGFKGKVMKVECRLKVDDWEKFKALCTGPDQDPASFLRYIVLEEIR